MSTSAPPTPANAYNVKDDYTQRWENETAVIDSTALKIHGHPVMESRESPYMLEVGFGMGIAADHLRILYLSGCTVALPEQGLSRIHTALPNNPITQPPRSLQ